MSTYALEIYGINATLSSTPTQVSGTMTNSNEKIVLWNC